ncbi:MAG TPA: hypothetical protein VMS38_29790 [Pseudorhodoferax sp.]|nr:hypothetical protein [Pseudorhodoferax sp.]
MRAAMRRRRRAAWCATRAQVELADPEDETPLADAHAGPAQFEPDLALTLTNLADKTRVGSRTSACFHGAPRKPRKAIATASNRW